MQKIVVFNPKGGSGKTTVSTNLASYYASQRYKTALMDYDPQGSSSFWLKQRSAQCRSIQSINAARAKAGMTRSWQLHLEPGTQRVVVDSPAGANIDDFRRTLNAADAILIPVLPSDIDIHAVTHAIADLLLRAKINRSQKRIAVIANRSRKNTLVYQRLERFLNTLDIPFVTTLRDTQNYVHAAEQGLGLFEMKRSKVEKDLHSWQPLIEWLDAKLDSSLEPELCQAI